jgi:5'-3' exonuclease
MEKLAKKFVPTAIYLSKDCTRDNIWRNDIYENYKSRKQLSDFDGRSFDVTFNEIIPTLTAQFTRLKIKRKFFNIPITIISNNKCEADDICYILCKHVFSNESKTVISGDHDYMQLIDDQTDVLDLKLKSLKEKSIGSASEDLIFKILIGDKSDNVPPICSKKYALDLIEKHTFDQIVEIYQDNQKFQLNRLLVDMDQIPDNLIEEVVNAI